MKLPKVVMTLYLIASVVHLNVISIHIDMLIGIIEDRSYGNNISLFPTPPIKTPTLPGWGFLALHAMSSANIKMMLLQGNTAGQFIGSIAIINTAH